MSDKVVRITSRAVSPATAGRTPAPLLSLRADGPMPIVGGLYTPGEPPLLVPAALHNNTDEHDRSVSVYESRQFSLGSDIMCRVSSGMLLHQFMNMQFQCTESGQFSSY
jgi:hypothetical protein